MANIIVDSQIPYVTPLPERFIPGKAIRIRGTVPAVAYRFNINLQCGPQQSADVALQIAVNLSNRCVTLNSVHNGIKGQEQRRFVNSLKCSTEFEIELMCHISHYAVRINSHHSVFQQRIHYDRITTLAISGDVSIIKIEYVSSSQLEPVSTLELEASAPLMRNHEFEVSNGMETSSNAISSLSSAPPSYDSVVYGNKSNSNSSNPPYPTATNSPHATPRILPYPTSNPRFPTPDSTTLHDEFLRIPFSTPDVGTRHSIPISGNINSLPYSPCVAPVVPPPPPPEQYNVPLNAASSNFRPVARKRFSNAKFVIGFFVLFGIIAFAIIVTKLHLSNKL